MALMEVWKGRTRSDTPSGVAPACDASCRLDERASVERSEAAIVTTRIR